MISREPLLPSPVPYSNTRYISKWKQRSLTAVSKCQKYFARLFRVNHMDFEYASWQMIYLFISPHKVYRSVYYRKQTKNQYSRDDPAFLVLLSFWFFISATGLSLVLQLPFFAFVKFLLWVVFIDCIGIGLIVATIFWFITNRYLRKDSYGKEDVEWGFAFDVHLNAFFPPLIIIHVFQLFFYNGNFISILLSLVQTSRHTNLQVWLVRCFIETVMTFSNVF